LPNAQNKDNHNQAKNKIYEQNNKRTDAQSSKKKNKTANMRPKKNGVDHHDSLLVSFVALGTIFFSSNPLS